MSFLTGIQRTWRRWPRRGKWTTTLIVFGFLSLSFVLVCIVLRSPSHANGRLMAVVHGNGFLDDYLNHVIRVLSRVGFHVRRGYVSPGVTSSLDTDEDWHVLWSHVYPFGDMPELKRIHRHQRVNKIPGMGFITNKASVCACLFV